MSWLTDFLYEAELRPWYRRYLRSGTIVYDIGAGAGDTTLLFARMVYPSGMIVAFEPRQDNLDRMQAKRGQVGKWLKSAQIVIVPKYVGSEGTDALQTRVDDVAKTIVPGFVKVDVDGWEVEVLVGMRETLRLHRPAVIVETHSRELERACQMEFDGVRYKTRIIPNAWWRVGPLREKFREGKQTLPDGTLTDGTHNRWLIGVPL